MARIYDNIENKFEERLKDILINSNVTRADFCEG
jgi:hypothetical protein